MRKLSSYLSFVTFAILFSLSPARAVSIGGQEYEKFLTFTTDEDFGYWGNKNKFYTYRDFDSRMSAAALAGQTTDIASSLSSYDVDKIAVMGTTSSSFGAVNSAVISLVDNSGASLLSGSLKPGSGKLDVVSKLGVDGELDLTGLFNVTGGSLFQNKLVTGTIYAEVLFGTISGIYEQDRHATAGVINLYWKGGSAPPSPNPVPEPATASLLGLGALGAASRRRKKPGRA